MPAPSISLSRGSVTYTMTPVVKNGFEISGSIISLAEGADWTLNASLRLVDAAVVPDEDETAAASLTGIKVPFNEAPSFADAQAKLQAVVDLLYDQLVPNP